jgi:hypothetical protein
VLGLLRHQVTVGCLRMGGASGNDVHRGIEREQRGTASPMREAVASTVPVGGDAKSSNRRRIVAGVAAPAGAGPRVSCSVADWPVSGARAQVAASDSGSHRHSRPGRYCSAHRKPGRVVAALRTAGRRHGVLHFRQLAVGVQGTDWIDRRPAVTPSARIVRRSSQVATER